MPTDSKGRCPDPECHGRTETEQDGDVEYEECVDCGYALGWRRITQPGDPQQSDTRCAVGVPEDVRRAASAFALNAQAAPLPLLQIGRRDARA